jgi:cobalt transporter subunit CbtB
MKVQESNTQIAAGSAPSSCTRTLAAPLATAALGALIIWVVGFSHVEVIHNVAHDTRHSHVFPCH